jgi:hypothetical protein
MLFDHVIKDRILGLVTLVHPFGHGVSRVQLKFQEMVNELSAGDKARLFGKLKTALEKAYEATFKNTPVFSAKAKALVKAQFDEHIAPNHLPQLFKKTK